GQPWTTAGRLVRTARRVGFLIACTAVLISIQLTFWPWRPDIVNTDNSMRRWIGGMGGNALLLFALLTALRHTRKYTLGWLVLLTIGSCVEFVLIRAPNATPSTCV